MPGFNKTGPMGKGQMTGRGMGVCTGNTESDTSNIVAGVGRGRGRGFGAGRGCRMGRGFSGGFGVSEIIDNDDLTKTLKDINENLNVINQKLADK